MANELLRFSNILLSQSVDLSSETFLFMMLEFHVRRLEGTVFILEVKNAEEKQLMILDMELSRSLIQLQDTLKLRSSGGSRRGGGTSIILDSRGRSKWKTMTKDVSRCWMSFSELFSRLQWPSTHREPLRAVLDFPRDGMITPWKWNAFVNILGPWKLIEPNFRRYVLGGGFVGYISRAHCETLLRGLAPKTVILRGSRSHPSMLAMSYRPYNDDHFVHLTNNPNFWSMKDFAPSLSQIAAEKGSKVSKSMNVYVPTASFATPFLPSSIPFPPP